MPTYPAHALDGNTVGLVVPLEDFEDGGSPLALNFSKVLLAFYSCSKGLRILCEMFSVPTDLRSE